MKQLLLALPLLLPACGEKGDDGGGSSSASTTPETTTVPSTTATPSTGDAAPSTCAEATDEDECMMVPPDNVYMKPCLWVPRFSVTQAADTCTFTPAGGSCLEYMPADTDCGLYAAKCGFDAYYAMNGADPPTLARIDESCSYYFTKELTLAFCNTTPDPMTNPLAALACQCACAANYPL